MTRLKGPTVLLTLSALAACSGLSEEAGISPKQEAAVARKALTGETLFVDTSCSGFEDRIRRVATAARQQLNDPRMLSCLMNGTLGGTITSVDIKDASQRVHAGSGYPEYILRKLTEPKVTRVTCHPGRALEGGSAAPRLDGEEELNISFGALTDREITDAMLTAIFLHEVAHTKAFSHPESEKMAWDIPYSVQHCSEGISAGLATPTASGSPVISRAQQIGEFTLSPVGLDIGNGLGTTCPGQTFATGINGQTNSWIGTLGLTCESSTGVRSSSPEVGDLQGTSFTSDCGPGQALVGFDGAADDYLYNLVPRCAAKSDVLAKRTNPISVGSKVGPDGGASFRRECPAGMVVKSARVRAWNGINQVELTCQDLSNVRPIETTLTRVAAPPTIRSPGTSVSRLECPGASIMRTLRAEAHLDALVPLSRLSADCTQATMVNGVFTFKGFPLHIPGTGGAASTAVQRYCPQENQGFIGFSVNTADLQDQVVSGVVAIQPICADVTAWRDPSRPVALNNAGFYVGNDNAVAAGQWSVLQCPRGSFASGWIVDAGMYINSLQVICRKL